MKNIYRFIVSIMLALALSACGTRVEVPPATVGKLMTKDGYQDRIIPPSAFRMPVCIWYCDRLILLDVSDKTQREELVVFIPTDKLNLALGVQVTLSLNAEKTNTLFSTLAPQPTKDPIVSMIEWKQIYHTYAQQIVLTETREYISQYSIGQIASSLQKVNADLRVILQKKLQEGTPFTVRSVGITSINYPKIITDAQENAAERRERIQQEEAQLEISRVTLERQLAEAQLQRQIEVEKAETEAQAQRIQREVVDDKVLALRRLENQQRWIEKWNGVVPTHILGEDAELMLQLQQNR